LIFSSAGNCWKGEGVIEMEKYQEKYGDEENSEDDNIYSESVKDRLLEDDELSIAEEGFMVGYLNA